MKQEINSSSISKNKKIRSWFNDSFGIFEERILLICNSNSQSKLFKNNNQNVEEILKSGEFSILNLIKIFNLKGNPRKQIEKAVENLKDINLKLLNENTGSTININLFEFIEKTKSTIKYKFTEEYLNYTMNNLNDGFFISLTEELKNFKSSYTPKLLRLLKSEVSLGVEEIIVKIDYEYLRKSLLGEKGARNSFSDRFVFNRKVLNVALNEINGGYYIEDEDFPNQEKWIRNTFVNAKLTYQENIGLHEDPVYVYYFKVGSSRKIAEEIAPKALQKSFATYEALKDYYQGIIHIINFEENREEIKYEKIEPSVVDKSKNNNKETDKTLMEDIPEF